MNKKDKNTFKNLSDNTHVLKPKIYNSYKYQYTVKDLGGEPGKNMTIEDRRKRQEKENNINAVKNVVSGLNKTFGTAISGASLFFGGGWALNRLLHMNKASNLGLFFGKYVLPSNTVDNVADGIDFIINPSISGAIDLGSGIVLGRFKDFSKPARQVGEIVGLGANVNNMKQGGKMNILEFLKNGSGIHIKEKNKGSFTRWCGGNVTEECIRRGKNSSNPKIRKKATFADNARHFKHQFGGLLGKTQEEVDIINNDNRNKAKGLFKGMLSGNILPTALNIGSMLNSAYNGWIEPETTYITGQAPSGGGSIKNPSKIVSSVSKLNNTGLPLTKKVNTNIKNTTTYLTGDNRYALSGLNKITRGLRERALYMITNHYADTLWNKDLVKYFKNREKAKARGANYRKFNLLINETLDDFIWNSGYFKEGGIIKVEDGTKLTFGLKINNWFKSDLGKVVTNGVSLLYTGLQENANLVKLNDLLQEWKKSYLKSIQPEDFSTLVNQEEALIKQSNPDYNSSPLVKLHKLYLLLTQALNRAREKAGMDADQYIQLYMLAQQNNSSSGDIFSGMLKTFLG